MKFDIGRYSHSFRYYLQEGSLVESITKKLHLNYNPKFDSNSFQFAIKEMLNDCRYVDAYNYIYDTLSSIDNNCSIQFRLWKYILQNDSEQAFRLIGRIKCCEMHRDEALMFRYGILGGDYVETDCVRQNPYFSNMLCNKKIAVIGPGNDPDIDLDAISKSHDVIVILNYSHVGSIEQYKSNPKCKVVSYYNFNNFSRILNSAGDKQALFYEPDALVLKSKEDVQRLNKDLYDSGRARHKLDINRFLYYGSPNMIQIASFDLMQFNPQVIDVYGCNFHLDKKIYREDYIGNVDMIDNKALTRSWALHNLIAQYQILYYFYKNKRINPDNMLREILDLGAEGFCAKAEKFIRK